MGNGRNAPRFPIGLGLMVFLLLVTIPILYIVGRNAETPEEAQAKLLQLTRGLSKKGGEPVEVEKAASQQEASPPPQDSAVASAEPGAPSETAPVAVPEVAVPADGSATPEKVVKPAPLVPSVPVPVATEVVTPVPATATPNALPLRASPIIAIPVDPNTVDEPVIEESVAAPLPTAETSPAPVAKPTAETESIRESATTPPVMPQVVSDRPRIKGTDPAVSQAETSKFVDPNHRFPRTR